MRSHFREPTQKQIDQQWSKQQVILGLQKMLQTMPRTNPREVLVWDKVLTTLGKMTGWFVPEQTVSTTNNLMFVTREQNREAWAESAKQQQIRLRDQTKMATDPRIDARNSG